MEEQVPSDAWGLGEQTLEVLSVLELRAAEIPPAQLRGVGSAQAAGGQHREGHGSDGCPSSCPQRVHACAVGHSTARQEQHSSSRLV